MYESRLIALSAAALDGACAVVRNCPHCGVAVATLLGVPLGDGDGDRWVAVDTSCLFEVDAEHHLLTRLHCCAGLRGTAPYWASEAPR
jgi:hypothetical protein